MNRGRFRTVRKHAEHIRVGYNTCARPGIKTYFFETSLGCWILLIKLSDPIIHKQVLFQKQTLITAIFFPEYVFNCFVQRYPKIGFKLWVEARKARGILVKFVGLIQQENVVEETPYFFVSTLIQKHPIYFSVQTFNIFQLPRSICIKQLLIRNGIPKSVGKLACKRTALPFVSIQKVRRFQNPDKNSQCTILRVFKFF